MPISVATPSFLALGRPRTEADDGHPTPTSELQRETEEEIAESLLPFLGGGGGGGGAAGEDRGLPLPLLRRNDHLGFCQKQLLPLPATHVFFDATRPWLVYWASHALYLLGRPLSNSLRCRAVATLLRCQHPVLGGFGGADGQLPHLMATYASVCALAINGAPGPAPTQHDIEQGLSPEQTGRGGWDDIDRPRLYRFLLSMKQPDGSFTVHMGGEVDVRATYCVVSVALLMGIATPELLEGVGDFVASCQTYEGGLGAASHPRSSGGGVGIGRSAGMGAPLGEAHGGYAFCATASHLALSLLPRDLARAASDPPGTWRPDGRDARSMASASLDVDALARWAASMQGDAHDAGGFRGRTNKLVDGCYGWFSAGGMFGALHALVELRSGGGGGGGSWPAASAVEAEGETVEAKARGTAAVGAAGSDSTGSWETINDEATYASRCALYDVEALQSYVLAVAQSPQGGLRDKPSSRPDAYHTCYNLAGLSAAQNRLRPDLGGEVGGGARRELEASFVVGGGDLEAGATRASDQVRGSKGAVPSVGVSPLAALRRACYASSLAWRLDEDASVVVQGAGAGAVDDEGASTRPDNRLLPTHPVFNVGFPRVKAVMDWAYGQPSAVSGGGNGSGSD